MGKIIPFQRKLKSVNEFKGNTEIPVINGLDIGDPSGKYIFEVTGDSMKPLIIAGDQLLVDKEIVLTLSPSEMDNILAVISLNGEFVIARLSVKGKKISLVKENKEFPGIEINKTDDFLIWGLITKIIRESEYS